MTRPRTSDAADPESGHRTRERDRLVLRARALAQSARYWRAVDDERDQWNARHPNFSISIAGHGRRQKRVGLCREAPHQPDERDPLPPALETELDNFLRHRSHGRSREPTRLSVPGFVDGMSPKTWKELAAIYPALTEWGMRVGSLLHRFFPAEDLFDGRPSPGALGFIGGSRAVHPASAFVGGSLVWGRGLVGGDNIDPAKVKRWIRRRPSAVVLRGDPSGLHPGELQARTELAVLLKRLAEATADGGHVDRGMLVNAVEQAREAGLHSLRALPRVRTHIAMPLDADVRSVERLVNELNAGRLEQRMKQLLDAGLTANRVAGMLGVDPETVRRKRPKR